MIRVQINGDQYGVPESCDDITLAQHIAMLEMEKTVPPIFAEISQERDPAKRKMMASKFPKLRYIKEVLPYFARVIEAQCKIPAKMLLSDAPVHVIENIYWKIQRAYVTFKDERQTVFVIDGAIWQLPTEGMAQSTFGEFAEAAQYEEYAADVAAGSYTRMPYVMAVLLRPRGEKFDPEHFDAVVEERAALMLQQPMTTVYQVAFFLTERKRQSVTDLAIYTASRAAAKLRRVAAN